jgi:hypothetical protein
MRNSKLQRCVAAAIALCTSGSLARADIIGFGSSSETGWTSNNASGSAASVAGVGDLNDILNITQNHANTADSYFYNTPQQESSDGWSASFTYEFNAFSGNPADGITFTLQNDPRGAGAVAGLGGNLGYGGFYAAPGNGNGGIGNSESMQFNLYNAYGTGIAQYADAGGLGGGGGYTNTGSVNLDAENSPINVNLNYNGSGTLTATLTQGSNSFTQQYAMPGYQQILGGGNTFLVGFTGGTGDFSANQLISNFRFQTHSTQVSPTVNIFNTSSTVIGVTAVPGAGLGANSPSGQDAPRAVDSNQPTKYLNFNKEFSGIVVLPTMGPTIANTLTLVRANDAPERDPASYQVWGTNFSDMSLIMPNQDPSNWQFYWTLIATGNIPIFSGRGQVQEFAFNNAQAFTNYLVDFPTLANSAAANSMQIGEIQLSGVLPEPGIASLLAIGSATALLRRRRRVMA